jgi:hypothetical protein
MAIVFLEGGLSIPIANGEHQTSSWTPPLGMSIGTFSNQRLINPKLQFLLNLDFFRIALH